MVHGNWEGFTNCTSWPHNYIHYWSTIEREPSQNVIAKTNIKMKLIYNYVEEKKCINTYIEIDGE